jgi:hydrogenase maturation protease
MNGSQGEPMQALECEVLVLGIGNVLWADEGFGVRCVEHLTDMWSLPDQVRVMDGGTQGLYLLPYVQAAQRLVVFDAIDYGLPTGTVKVVEDDEVPRFMGAKKMSLHQTGFQEVIAAAALTGQLPAKLLLYGVQPEELEDYGGSLRPAILARVAPVVELAVARLIDWGFDVVRRSSGLSSSSPLALGRYEAERPSPEQACRLGDDRFLRLRQQQA